MLVIGLYIQALAKKTAHKRNHSLFAALKITKTLISLNKF